MPEGDTVYRAAQLLDRTLSGQALVSTDFRVPHHATADLSSHLIIETVSRGKHLLTRFADGTTLHTHLKMEGGWRVYAPGVRWERPVHQARVVLTTHNSIAVGFSLGIVELVPTNGEYEVVGHLGPDLLGPDWDEAEAVRRISADPDRPLIEALVDQTNVAGIGNMYAAELSFVSGAHPLSPVRTVPDLRRLMRRAHQMLSLNKERAIQSTTGDLRQRERYWVFRRDRLPCRRCRTIVRVARRTQTYAGSQSERATYWCPSCQPLRD